MPTWFDFIKIELDGLDLEQIHQPSGEIESDEHEVGEADEELKRLYGLWMQLARSADEAMVDMRYAPTQAERDLYSVVLHEIVAKLEIVRDIFWASVRAKFSLWDKPNVGLRGEWKIVWFNEPRISNPIREIGE